MKKGLLWAILAVLVIGVILYALANKEAVEEGASQVTDNAERVLEAEVDPTVEEDAQVEEDAATSTEADADTEESEESAEEDPAEAPIEAEEDPSFEAEVDATVQN